MRKKTTSNKKIYLLFSFYIVSFLILTPVLVMVLIKISDRARSMQAGTIPVTSETILETDQVLVTPEVATPQGMSQASSEAVLVPENEQSTGNGLWKSPFSISIAAIHQVKPEDESVLAAYNALSEAEKVNAPFPTLLDALIASGATGTRVEVKWKQIQPSAPIAGQPVEYDWRWNDDKLGLIGSAGIQMIATIEMANEWAVDPEQPACGPVNPDHMDDFVVFLHELVTRYKEPPYNIRVWELDNEPDSTAVWGEDIGQGCWGHYGERYAEMLSYAYPAIKAADPEATVLMGGLAYDSFLEYGGNFERYFADAVMSAGGGNSYDIHNIHYFTDFREEWERWNLRAPTCGVLAEEQGVPYDATGIDVTAKANHFRNRMLTCHGVDKPLWFTEIAASSGREGNHDLEWQARYVPQVYTRAFSIGVGNITWYGLTTPNQTDEQGLLFEDFSPKPSFFAYRTMTTQLKDFKYARTLSEAGNVEGYAFQNSTGSEKYVLWQDEANTSENAQYTLNPANQVLVVDYLGRESIVLDGGSGDMDGSQNGIVVLRITQDPVYITTN